MLSFEILYKQFLSSISSYTLLQLSDDEIQAELFTLIERSIGTFKFPKVELVYSLHNSDYQYYFDSDVTQRELGVLLAWMKVYWVEFQISKEELLQNQYYDDNVRTFSVGNLLAQLNRMYENFVEAAKRAEYDYGRVASDGRPRVGDINV